MYLAHLSCFPQRESWNLCTKIITVCHFYPWRSYQIYAWQRYSSKMKIVRTYLISLHNLKQKYLCKKFGLNQPYAHNFLFSLKCNSILPRGKEIFILELWNAIIINYNVHNCVHFMLYSLLRLNKLKLSSIFVLTTLKIKFAIHETLTFEYSMLAIFQ